MSFSVAIIGAGPAGATAAIALASRGVGNVLLLDKASFPRDKTCASGLSPNAVALLDELGAGAEVRRSGYRIDGLRLVTPGGREMHLVSKEAAIVFSRRRFDELLVERAKSLGVCFRSGFHATALVHRNGRIAAVRAGDGEEVVCTVRALRRRRPLDLPGSTRGPSRP